MAQKNRNKGKAPQAEVSAPAPVAVETAAPQAEVSAPAAPVIPAAPKLSTITEASKPIRSRTNRQTGTRIVSYPPSEPGASWPVACLVHGTVRHYSSRKAGKATVYTPASWCEGCAGILAEKQAIAKLKAQEALAKAAEAPQVVEA